MKRLATLLLMTCGTLSGALAAQPDYNLADGRSGDIEFASFAPPGHNALSQATFDRKPVLISGKLMLPPGDGKVPAVVIGHTVGGIKPVLYQRWAKSLNDAGYAVFVVDSFGPRSMANMWTKSAAEINGAFLIADAFKALALLATHPRIDSDKIAFVGFSMGATTAHFLLHERFRRAVLGDVPLRFATAISHYPSCHYDFVENKPSPVPLFLFLAEKDDWTPALACQEYGAYLLGRGYKVTTKVYEGAGHGYDEDLAARHQADSASMSGCSPLVVNLDESVLAPQFLRGGAFLAPGADTRTAAMAVYKWAAACASRGASLGISAGGGDRRDEAVRDTIKALQSVFVTRPS